MSLKFVQNYRYVVALKNNQYGYFGFNTSIELQTFIQNKHNAYQLTRCDIRRLFFVVNTTDFNEDFLIQFFNHLGKITNINFKTTDFQYYTHDNITQIISNSYKTNTITNKSISIELIEQYFYDIDTSYYSNCVLLSLDDNYIALNQTPKSLLWLDEPSECNLICVEFQKTEEEYGDVFKIIMNNKQLLSSNSWFDLLKNVKQNEIMTREEFCLKTLVNDYRYENNLIKWDNAELVYVQNLETILSNHTNKIIIDIPFNNHFFQTIKADDETKQWFLTQPKQQIYKYKNIEFNTKNGVLTYDNITTLYYFDKFIHTNNDFRDVNDLQPLIEEFKNNNEKYLCLRAKWGSGKTHNVITPLIHFWDKKRILILTENNNLNRQFASTFSNFSSHLHDVIPPNPSKLICSLESIHRFKDCEFDVVICDEFISLMTHYTSSTMKRKELNNFIIMMNFFDICDKMIICDADLTNEFDIFPKQPIYNYTISNYYDYIFNIHLDKLYFFHKIETDLKANKNVVIVSNTKSGVKNIIKTLTETHINYLCITADGKFYNEIDISQSYNSLDETIMFYKPKVLIYSPSLLTGVSFNIDYFDVCYAINSNNSVNARQFTQMLFRVRRLTEKTINIFVGKTINKPTKRTTVNDELIKLKQSVEWFKMEFKEKEIENNTKYSHIVSLSRAENENSKNNFMFEFYTLLKSHNLNINILLDKTEKTNEIDNEGEVNIEELIITKMPSNEELEDLIIACSCKKKLTTKQQYQKKKLDLLLNEWVYVERGSYGYKYRFYGLFNLTRLKQNYPFINNVEFYTKYLYIKSSFDNITKNKFNHSPTASDATQAERVMKHHLYKVLCEKLALINKLNDIIFTDLELQQINRFNKTNYTQKDNKQIMKTLNKHFVDSYGVKFMNTKHTHNLVMEYRTDFLGFKPIDLQINEHWDIKID